jgi:hypothetical protein
MKVYGSLEIDGELQNVKIQDVMPEVVIEDQQEESEDDEPTENTN